MSSSAIQFPFVSFSVHREYVDENGIWNPRDDDPPLEVGLQINLMGTREHYLKLADAIRAFAEQDTSHDGDFHQHIEGVFSHDGRVRLHLIARKDDVGDSILRELFPRS